MASNAIILKGQAGRLAENTCQFIKNRAIAIRSIEQLITRSLFQQQACVSQTSQLFR